jgi:Holliday junction resolvase RusA-like endonuclease
MNPFVIPGELTDLNTYINEERKFRLKGSKIKELETRRVWAEAKNKHLGRIQRPVAINIEWFLPNRKKDPDNIAFAKKFILDGLRDAGVLENDGWKQITGFIDTFHVDPRNPRVEVYFI